MHRRMAGRVVQQNIAASVLEEACIAEQQKHARVHELYVYMHMFYVYMHRVKCI